MKGDSGRMGERERERDENVNVARAVCAAG